MLGASLYPFENNFTDEELESRLVVASAMSAGTVLVEDSVNAGQLVAATDKAGFVLARDVTSSGPSTEQLLLGVRESSTKAGDPADVYVLRPGHIFATNQYVASGTGAITAATAVGTELGVSNGQFMVKQATGTGSVRIAVLHANRINQDGTIVVRVVALA